MEYRTPEEVYTLVLGANHNPKLKPILDRLRQDGGFSNRLAGLIDRLQDDEEFRRMVMQNNNSFEIGRNNFLANHEIFALVTAAMMLDPNSPFPRNMSLKISESSDDLASRFRCQPFDWNSVRKEKMDQFIQMMIQDSNYLQTVVYSPSVGLGAEDFNRSEFALLYFQAAVLYMATTKSRINNGKRHM